MEIKSSPSSNETIKSGEEMNSWEMKAVNIRIEPTCDEHYSESLESLEVEELKWDALPNEVKESIMRKLNYENYSN